MGKFGIFAVLALVLTACSVPQPQPASQPDQESGNWLAVRLEARDANGVPLPAARQAELQEALRAALDFQFKDSDLRQVTLVLDGTTLTDPESGQVEVTGSCSLFRGKTPAEIPAEPIPASWRGRLGVTNQIGLSGYLTGEYFVFDADGNCRRTMVSPNAYRIEIGADPWVTSAMPPKGVEFQGYVGGVILGADKALKCDQITVRQRPAPEN